MALAAQNVNCFSKFCGKAHISGASVFSAMNNDESSASKTAPRKKRKKSRSSNPPHSAVRSRRRSSTRGTRKTASRAKDRKKKPQTIVQPEIITLTGDRKLPAEKPTANRLITACIKELRFTYNECFLAMKKRVVDDHLGEKINFQVEKLVPQYVKTSKQLSDDKQNGWYALILTRGFCGVDVNACGVPALYLSVRNGKDAEPRDCHFQWSVYNAHRYMNQAIPEDKLQRFRTLVPRLSKNSLMTWKQFQREELTIPVERFSIAEKANPLLLPFADPKFLKRFMQLTEEKQEAFISRCNSAKSGKPRTSRRKRRSLGNSKKKRRVSSSPNKEPEWTPQLFSGGQLQGPYPPHAPGELERTHNLHQSFAQHFSTYEKVPFDDVEFPTGVVKPSDFPIHALVRVQAKSLHTLFKKEELPLDPITITLFEPKYNLSGVFSMNETTDLSVTPGSHMIATSVDHNETVMQTSRLPWKSYYEAHIIPKQK